MRDVLAITPGSCGELVQGSLDGVAFHISCPIAAFSMVRIRPAPQSRDFGLGFKALTAVRKARRRLRFRRSVWIEAKCGLVQGVGMASSTADIGASVSAVFAAAGVRPCEIETASLAVKVEPSDGTIFPGIVAFDHKRGRYMSRLGVAPDIHISYVETGGTVDTVQFNRNPIRYTASQKAKIRLAFDMAVAGLRHGDRHLIGAAASMSARINQDILPKPGLDELLEIASEHCAYGVVVAHSGTVMGVLHDQNGTEITSALAQLSNRQPTTVRMVNGGSRTWVL